MAVPSLPAAVARQLRVVTFDITGTLLNFRHPPEQQYSQAGAQMGVYAEPSELAKGFRKQWKILSDQHPNFGAATGLPWHSWWSKLVVQTFLSAPSLRFEDSRVKGNSRELRLETLADHLIEAYSSAECWSVVEGAENTLSSLRKEGLVLGVVSNFDCRLHGLLRSVGLQDFFSFTMVSYELGVAKPDARIFHQALRRAEEYLEGPLEPQEACHVGDTPSSDYVGAKGAGWHAVLVSEAQKEGKACAKVDPGHVVASLKELEVYLLDERRWANCLKA
ncbi:haloacid dehalogenase-like hydrolase domain-containing protein 3 [Ischnura elegans]|uniref:haloacid dehalogenase-like hydrolase domain-containing protein 3 n=1 Tax=Ischnura elegans TaxID=197161 RepID=UPI001ED8944B|nr:haloacid dehalogenase-like hydrolase domain-containing protein 3 [Ischnura elegans]